MKEQKESNKEGEREEGREGMREGGREGERGLEATYEGVMNSKRTNKWKNVATKKRRAKSDIDDGGIFVDIENYFLFFEISFNKSLEKNKLAHVDKNKKYKGM